MAKTNQTEVLTFSLSPTCAMQFTQDNGLEIRLVQNDDPSPWTQIDKDSFFAVGAGTDDRLEDAYEFDDFSIRRGTLIDGNLVAEATGEQIGIAISPTWGVTMYRETMNALLRVLFAWLAGKPVPTQTEAIEDGQHRFLNISRTLH